MNREAIEQAVVEILIKHGPDGHCDGADKITDFIMTLLEDATAKYHYHELGAKIRPMTPCVCKE